MSSFLTSIGESKGKVRGRGNPQTSGRALENALGEKIEKAESTLLHLGKKKGLKGTEQRAAIVPDRGSALN